jgi:site-specific DNA-methyltransferase (adenine-specific)
MQGLSDSSIDMIYLDPPFFTQKKQSLTNSNGNLYAFSDVWDSLEDYLNYMRLRITEMKRLLKSTGCIFLHCDTSASHYLRMLLDDIFGCENFRSEIIWSYKRWSNSRKGLLPGHQTIFYYTKTSHYTFNTLYKDYSATTNIDQILQERERDHLGKAVYKRDSSGGIVAAKEKKGVPLSDVWEIPFLNPKAKERTGYPTQKPIELLERIIKISTNEGDTILDPFCGSGTTLVSAKLLNRDYIGIDINADAIQIAESRLQAPQKTTSVLLKIGEAAYKTKTAEELAILHQFNCDIVQRNRGIDAFLKKHYLGHPVAIKIQRHDETFVDSLQRLEQASKKKKCSFAILITFEKNWKEFMPIPRNIFVINQYCTQFELMVDELLSQAMASGN